MVHARKPVTNDILTERWRDQPGVSQLAQGDFDAYWLSAGIAGAAAMGTAGSWSGPTVLSPVVRRMDMLGCCSSAPASAIRVRKSKAGRAFSRCAADGGPLTRRTWARRAKVGRGAQSHGVSWLARWWQGATWAGGTRRVDREMPEGLTQVDGERASIPELVGATEDDDVPVKVEEETLEKGPVEHVRAPFLEMIYDSHSKLYH